MTANWVATALLAAILAMQAAGVSTMLGVSEKLGAMGATLAAVVQRVTILEGAKE